LIYGFTMKKFQSGKILAISFGHLFHDIYSSFLSPMIPLLVSKLGISLSLAGFLDVIKNSPSLLNPFLGLMADRICVKYFVIFTPSITAVIMSLIGIAPSYSILAIMVFVMGISSTLFHIPSPVLIKNLSADKTGRGMSYYMLGGELSRTLGPLIITGAITIWGFEGTWRLIPFGLAASFVLYIKLKNFSIDKDVDQKQIRIKTSTAFKELIPLLSYLGGFLFFMTALKLAVTLYLPAYLVNQGKTLISASFSLAVLQFSGAAGTLFAGPISDKIGRKTTLLISSIACPILMWLFIIVNDTFMLPILAALGFFLFSSGPVILALVQDANSHSPSFANGMYMTSSFIIRSIIILLVGHYIEKFGYNLTYKISAILAIGAIPFTLFIPLKMKGTKSLT
jgi:MFS transporter, FSR family, fosmidomycin resistance protein